MPKNLSITPSELEASQIIVRSLGHHLRSPLVEVVNQYEQLLDELKVVIPLPTQQAMSAVQARTLKLLDSLSILSELLLFEEGVFQLTPTSLNALVVQACTQLEKEGALSLARLVIDVPSTLPQVNGGMPLYFALQTALRMFAVIFKENLFICATQKAERVELHLRNIHLRTKLPRVSPVDFLQRHGESHSISLFICKRIMKLIGTQFSLYGNDISEATLQVDMCFSLPLAIVTQ
ncbi:MAG: hypothetical protein KF716_25645 [Anaerolineae bacterium]|nr:hypothetical protein [Anaerolineae bacterium]